MEFLWIEFGTPLFDAAIDLRHRVLREPLQLEFFPEDIEAEYDSGHLAVILEDLLVGCLVMKPLSEAEVKMRQVAVDPQFQNLGIGGRLVEESERWARASGFKLISLHARESAVRFYLKMDYLKEGERFEEVGIPHFRMIKVL